jgi:hypothetical protein
MLEPLTDIKATADRLIAEHGRDAANQAFMEALDESVIGDKIREGLWINVAVEIMTTQRGSRVKGSGRQPATCLSVLSRS